VEFWEIGKFFVSFSRILFLKGKSFDYIDRSSGSSGLIRLRPRKTAEFTK